MNNELSRPLSLIEAEINFYSIQTAQGMVEIGKRLIEAKEQIPHGEWGKWLEEKIEYSQDTANNFMKIAREYPNSEPVRNLTYRKILALTSVSAEERESFTEQNNIEEMTARQVEAAVKEWKAKAEKTEADLQKANQTIQNKKDDIKFLQESMQEDKEIKDTEIRKLEEQLEALKSKGSNSQDIEKLESELKEAKRQVEILTDEMMKPVELEPAVVEKIVEKVPEDVERELTELRVKVGQQVNPETIKFKVHFDSLVKGFQELLVSLSDITDNETHSKYKNATVTLIDKMLEKL